MDRQRSFDVAAGNERLPFSLPSGRIERFLRIPWLVAAPVCHDPDLEQLERFGLRGIDLGMGDAGPGRHRLDLVGLRDT